MVVTKSSLTEILQAELNCTRIKAKAILETLLETMKTALESGDDILISGFGKFEVKQKAKRRGRNPRTGSDLMIRPRKVVRFKSSALLREKINGLLWSGGDGEKISESVEGGLAGILDDGSHVDLIK